MMRVVVDTSVLIRYLLKPSRATKHFIEHTWLNELITVVTAPELMSELAEVLARPKIRRFVAQEDASALIEALTIRADILPPLGDIPTYTRDRKDDKFLACALLGDAEFLITYDEDLLVLGKFGAVAVVTPETLEDLLGDEQS
jgi:putative PIN family toxin of toxin-antitoxin system